MKTTLAVIFAVIIVAMTTIPVWSVEKPGLRTGDPLPPRTFPTLAGTTMTIPDEVKGKVTVIHFWTDGCGKCRKVMPGLDAIYEQYRQTGLQIIAVNVGQKKALVKRFVDETGIRYPVLLDLAKESAGVYSVVGLPRTYLLDRKGIVRYKILGEAPADQILKLIQKLL